MTEANKAILRQVCDDVFGAGDLAVADSSIAADCIDHNPLSGQLPGREGILHVAAMLREAFPIEEHTFHLFVAEGDRVAAHWTRRCHHRGPFFGTPATGKPLTITGTDLVRIADGQIVEWWHNEDVLGVLQQLGPATAPAGAAGHGD